MVQFTLFLHQATNVENIIPWPEGTIREFSGMFTDIKTIVTNNVCSFWRGRGVHGK